MMMVATSLLAKASADDAQTPDSSFKNGKEDSLATHNSSLLVQPLNQKTSLRPR